MHCYLVHLSAHISHIESFYIWYSCYILVIWWTLNAGLICDGVFVHCGIATYASEVTENFFHQSLLVIQMWHFLSQLRRQNSKRQNISCAVWCTQQTKLVWLVYFDALNLTLRIGHIGKLMPTLEAVLFTCDLFHISIWFGAVLG